jgi:uncharacterized integral membrane protein (TIGR02327 family)
MLQVIGQQALVGMFSHLIFLVVTWWALQALSIDKMIRANRVVQARLLLMLLTIAIGTSVSNFFLDFLSWSQSLPSLFF